MRIIKIMEKLGTYQDSVVGAPYSLNLFDSAKELSNKLKDTYRALGIETSQFNSGGDYEGLAENPPREIYEYQNFFLLEKTDGNIILLDGFRRLLWYNAPDSPITVRTYKQSNLTSSQILTLLVNLNHFKFFQDSQSYQERGFGLLLKTVFDIDISKFRKAFDAYLSSNETKNSYSLGGVSGNSKSLTIKERIVNEHFVSDMKFLSKLNDEKFMVNKFFGALLYQKRLAEVGEFSADKFIELASVDSVLKDLMVKFEKAGTNNSSKSQDAVNQIQEIYNNYFTLMSGGEIEKSYAEKVQECKELRDKFNKDKNWTKLTGHKDAYAVESAMKNIIKKDKGVSLEFKMIVLPEKSYKDRVPLEYGENELLGFNGMVKSKHYGGSDEIELGFKDPKTGAEFIIKHNYGGYNSYGKKYTEADMKYNEEIQEKYNSHFNVSYYVEVWVNVPQIVWKKLENERLGRIEYKI
jgi:hypothetical protein